MSSSQNILSLKFNKLSLTKYNSITPNEGEFYITDENVLEKVYPVGSIYLSVNSINPSELFGFGTWMKISEGRVLQGADSSHLAGTTINAGLPNITGNIRVVNEYDYNNSSVNNVIKGAFKVDTFPAATGAKINQNTTVSGDGIWAVSFNASRSSSIYGTSTTVQPPAFIVNIWQRTS